MSFTSLTEEQRQTVKYLRLSPKDSLKQEAADLIEELVKTIRILENNISSLYDDLREIRINTDS